MGTASGESPSSVHREAIAADIRYLASDDLKGRGVDSPSIDVAADYLAGRMRAIGLRTDAYGGEPFQPVEISLGSRPGPADANWLRVHRPGDPQPILSATLAGSDTFTAGRRSEQEPSPETAGDDFEMMPMAIGSDRGTVRGAIAVVGYGIDASEFGYDDYAGIDVSGCIVMVLRKEPGNENPDSKFEGTRTTRHAMFSTKIRRAISAGAAAVLLVNDRGSLKSDVERTLRRLDLERQRLGQTETQLNSLPEGAEKNRAKLEQSLDQIRQSIVEMQAELDRTDQGLMQVSTAGRRGPTDASIPVASISRTMADAMIRMARPGRTLDELETKLNRAEKPDSFFLTPLMAKLRVELKPSRRTSPNVIGWVPGKGALAGESVIVGAHYDHVGMGGYGSLAPGTVAVHNGADDNASGVAAMLEIASQVQRRLRERTDHRRVIAIAFTGEERGLVGSRQYVASPRFELERTAAMVNLDMVGRLRDNELTVYGTGSGTGLDRVVEDANLSASRRAGGAFDLFKIPSGYGPSDHQTFYEAGVPVLFFFTGLHNDYHRPSDDFDKIDLIGLTRITDTVSDVMVDLATRSQRPTLVETNPEVSIRRQLSVRMGIQMVPRSGRIELSAVVPNSSADRGGLKPGDVLRKVGGQTVASPGDVLRVLRNRRPGDSLRVVWDRDGEPMNVTLRLEARP